MKSVIRPHFPQIVYENNEKLLFNPLLKKRFANRPEERVRLRWVEYILTQTDHLKTRIGFERPVDLPQKENQLRADLILYNRDMKPHILIECKAPSVRLSGAAATQAAMYNSQVGADFICLTNGVTDFWFRADNEQSLSEEELPLNEIHSVHDLADMRDEQWWASRGFLSDASDSPLNQRLVRMLNYVVTISGDFDIRYLNFKDSPLSYGLNHYFAVIKMDAETRLAISVLGKEGEDPVLAAVLNRAGKNEGLLIIDLMKCSRKEPDSGLFYSAGTERTFPAHQKFPYSQSSSMPMSLTTFLLL